jgi:6-phosphogluconolactonase
MLSVNPIEADGVPGEPLQVLHTPPKAHSILPDPENHAVYAAVLGGDVILRQPFDPATGRMAGPVAAVVHTAAGAGPRHLRFARGGALLYCVNELDGTLNTYARDPASGALTELQSVRLVPPAAPGKTLASADMHLTPDERFLYASERFSNVLVGFRVHADGTLETLGTVAGEAVPRGFAIDPRGRWLLCAGQQTGCVAVYGIDARSGALTRLAAYAAGGNANWIEIVDLPA